MIDTQNDVMSGVQKSGNQVTLDPMQIIKNQKRAMEQSGEINTPGSTLKVDPALQGELPQVNAPTPEEIKQQQEIAQKINEVSPETEAPSMETANHQTAATMSNFKVPEEKTEFVNPRRQGRPNLFGKVDLSSVVIQKDFSETDIVRNAQNILSIESTFQVNFLQSGYMAEISALTNHELRAMSTNVTDYYSLKKKSYQTIFRHMMSTSIGQIDFDTFLKITSYLDEPTLYYGAFCQTFQGNNKYTVYCNEENCKGARDGFEADVHNYNLVRIDGDEVKTYQARNELVERAKRPAELVGKSLVHQIKRIILEESNFIVDIRIPSLDDYLNEALYNKDPNFLEEYGSEIGVAFFVEQILIPNYDRFDGNPQTIQWLPVTGQNAKINYISKLFTEDYQQLVDEIDEFNKQYRISYAIQNVVCPHCQKQLGDVNISMEDVLFTLTNSRRRKSKTE